MQRRSQFHRGIALAVVLVLSWLAPTAVGRQYETSDIDDGPRDPRDRRERPEKAVQEPRAQDAGFLRIVETEGGIVALEIAARTFRSSEPDRPEVALVGVAHIADRRYYRAVQKLLEASDVVLYESVMPAGAKGASGRTDQRRIESTRQAMGFVAGLLANFHADRGRYPDDTAELHAFAAHEDPRLAGWLDAAMIDAWDRPLVYRLEEDAATYLLQSLGADGKPGGAGAASDLAQENPASVPPLELASDRGLQAELAAALDLQFQLTALDYGKTNWQCSDMTLDELQQALEARGVEIGPLQGMLDGTSFPARLATVLLRFVRFADALMDGAISDVLKLMLIETLSDEELIQHEFEQFDPAFAEVIVGQRNQVVIDDLTHLLEREPKVQRVAILYGAAHMPDFAERLTGDLGYERAGARWIRAIEVDLTSSALSEAELNQMRQMFRQMMRRPMPRRR